jgi:hypothetical protein
MREAFARYIRVRRTRAPFCNAQSIRNALIERCDASTPRCVEASGFGCQEDSRRLRA